MASLGNAVTLDSAPDRAAPADRPRVARSGVPLLHTPEIKQSISRTKAGMITVDPRRLVGEGSELWTFSLDVHKHVNGLVARVWKSLRRAGVSVPAMSYGTEWALYEPRTGRTIEAPSQGGAESATLEEIGIRAGTILWVVRPGMT